MNYLVTGAAGFIGNHVALKLLQRGETVIGVDNLNQYYDVELKKNRLKRLNCLQGYTDICLDLKDSASVEKFFSANRIDYVVHLAAQAGVRHSLAQPHSYIESNITGMLNVLIGCQQHHVKHLVYASSSSVYGGSTQLPFSEHGTTDHPKNLYAASKKANELMAHSYSHLYGIPATGLRFFTVYGPWGRPDMALFKFTKSILLGEEIEIFNHGKMKRDFTYIDDIVEGVMRVLDNPAKINDEWSSEMPDPASSGIAPHRVYNIGNNQPVDLLDYVRHLENKLGRKAKMNLLPLQAGDVINSWARVDDLVDNMDYKPSTPVGLGISNFVDWYLEYFRSNYSHTEPAGSASPVPQ